MSNPLVTLPDDPCWICGRFTNGCCTVEAEEMATRKQQFQELIDGGMPRRSANVVMIGRMRAAANIKGTP